MSSTLFLILCINLMSELMVSHTSSLSQFPGNIDCQIVGNTEDAVTYQLTINFENQSSTDASSWYLIEKKGISKYWIEGCSSAMRNRFCGIWETDFAMEKKECKRIDNSESVLCKIAIRANEETSTNPAINAVFVKHNSTHAWEREIHWYNCSCNSFSFNPNLDISNWSMPGKADVKVTLSSKNFRQVSDIEINIIPNNGAIIKEYKKENHYEVSGFDICQKYVIGVSLEIAPACGKSKINSSVIEFPEEKFIVDETYCFYNQTHINITMNSVSLPGLYLNLTLLNNIFMRNITNTLTLPMKKLKDITFQNFSANFSLCVHRCRKCGVTRSFICYSKNPPLGSDSANTGYFSTSIIVVLGIVGGLLFIVMCISLFWFIFVKRKMTYSLEKRKLRKTNLAGSTLSNANLIQSPNDESIFTEVQELLTYDQQERNRR